VSNDYQEPYTCEYYEYENADFWYNNNYLNSWYCPVCDANEYEANDGIYDKLNSEKEIRSWLVSEHGRRYTPAGNRLIKAKLLVTLLNNIYKLSDTEETVDDLQNILEYLKFKYKLIKIWEFDDIFSKYFKEIIIKLLSRED